GQRARSLAALFMLTELLSSFTNIAQLLRAWQADANNNPFHVVDNLFNKCYRWSKFNLEIIGRPK
ncbi:MAG: hypothetical protein AAB971_02120, partial [Patescibacteria group bacterium]